MTKKIMTVLTLSLLLSLGNGLPARAETLPAISTTEYTIIEETPSIQPRKIDKGGTFKLAGKQSFQYSFQTGSLTKPQHNAFTTVVKIIKSTTPLLITITNDKGYYYSKEITKSTTFTTKNCNPDAKYTVKFSTNGYNVDDSVSGTFSITSFCN